MKLGITATHEPLDQVDLFAPPLATAVVFGIWCSTSPTFLLKSERHGRRMAWVYLHFPMHLSLVAAAVALAHTLVAEDDETDPGQFEFGSIQHIVIPVVMILLAIGLIGLVGGPRELARQRLRVFLRAAAAPIAEAVLLGVDSYDPRYQHRSSHRPRADS